MPCRISFSPTEASRYTGMMRNGFASPLLVLGIVCGVLALACAALWKVAGHEREQRAKVEGQFAAFQEGVRKAGDEQKAKNDKLLKERERIHASSLKSLQNRYSDLDARYAGLRNQSANPGSGGLPPVPDATRPTDDAARDNRLLEVLRHADQQTAQMIELQEWIKQQK